MIKFDDSTLKRYVTEVKLLGNKDFVDVARESLNEAAIFAKKTAIQKSANDKFTVRNKTFFKAMTSFELSRRGQSTTLSGLYSRVGMANNSKKSGLSSDYDPLAIMEEQEHGGVVDRKVTPLNKSRISNSYSRAVSKPNLFSGDLITQSEMRGKNAKQRFRIALEMAKKKNQKFFLSDEFNAVYAIKGRTFRRVFGYKPSNKNRLKATHFMEQASRHSAELIPAFFIKEAIKKIEFRAKKIK